jgi:hypothetical protein
LALPRWKPGSIQRLGRLAPTESGRATVLIEAQQRLMQDKHVSSVNLGLSVARRYGDCLAAGEVFLTLAGQD